MTSTVHWVAEKKFLFVKKQPMKVLLISDTCAWLPKINISSAASTWDLGRDPVYSKKFLVSPMSSLRCAIYLYDISKVPSSSLVLCLPLDMLYICMIWTEFQFSCYYSYVLLACAIYLYDMSKDPSETISSLVRLQEPCEKCVYFDSVMWISAWE